MARREQKDSVEHRAITKNLKQAARANRWAEAAIDPGERLRRLAELIKATTAANITAIRLGRAAAGSRETLSAALDAAAEHERTRND